MSDEEKALRLPSERKLELIREALLEDEDWRFGRIRLDRNKPRFELPTPTKDDPDNVEIANSFYGVILVAKKNFYQSDEDKEKGIEPKEKRALYILRAGKYMPELLYVSPTAIRNWKFFARDVVQSGKDYYEVLCLVTAEKINGKQYTWTKPKFAIGRTLTEEEVAHVQLMREYVSTRVKEYESNVELDSYEDKALAVDKSKDAADDDEEGVAKRQQAAIEDDDEDETPKAPAKAKKSKSMDDDEDEKPAKPKKPADDDDEDEKPAKPKKPAKPADDDDEDGKPVKPSKGRAGYPDLDDDEDDLSDVGKKGKKDDDEDD